MVCVVAVPATSTVANTSENCRCFIFVVSFFKKENCSYITEIICHSWYIILLHLVVKNKLTKYLDNIQQCSRISESDSNAAAAAAFSRDIFRRITTVVQDFFLETDYNNRTLNRILVVGILLLSFSSPPGALVVV